MVGRDRSARASSSPRPSSGTRIVRVFLEGVGDCLFEAECSALGDRVVPRVRAMTCAGRLEVDLVQSRGDAVLGLAVPVAAGGAVESRRAIEVVVDGGGRGEAGEAFGREGPHDQLTAECELL